MQDSLLQLLQNLQQLNYHTIPNISVDRNFRVTDFQTISKIENVAFISDIMPL